jgi:hypothetical protein
VLALAAWAVIPVNAGWVISDINVGILYIFAISSLGVYGVIMAGWASNSKYPFLAALRSAAQMVSYEVSIGFVIITVLLCVGSLNLSAIVEAQNSRWGLLGWYWLPLFPMLIIFFVSALAETNRPPFDLVEADSELVAGYMVEYGSTPYMMLMMGEYIAICTMCAICTILFPGGAIHLGPWHRVVFPKSAIRIFHVRNGESVRAPLSLRPTDAARLESIFADLVGHGGDCRRGVAGRRMGAEMKTGGRHGHSTAGLARRLVRNDRRGRDLRSGNPARGTPAARLERCQHARAARRIGEPALGRAAPDFGSRRRTLCGGRLLDRQHGRQQDFWRDWGLK